jgi:hypothetical protein
MCALKVSLSTVKGKLMEAPDPELTVRPARQRLVRAMRLGAVLAVIMALTAIVLVLRGQDEAKAEWLIAIALGTGLAIMAGMAIVGLPHLRGRSEALPYNKKDKNDSRP